MEPLKIGEQVFYVDGPENNRTWHPAIVTKSDGAFGGTGTVFLAGEETYVETTLSNTGMPGFFTRLAPPA